MEPRASAPHRRLAAIRELAAAGIPVGVMVAPVIPGLTDHELPAILAAAAEAGATRAGYIVVRLPHAVKEIFQQWLADHAPGKSARVLDRIRQIRGGSLNVSEWGKRLKGEGIFADQLRVLFTATARAEDPASFTAKLDPADQTAAGLAKLSPAQLAALDTQIAREITVARQGDVIAFARSFMARRTGDQLTAAGLASSIGAATGAESLAFFDAIAPIVHFESIDMETAWFQSRWNKGE
eukprot:gene8328-10602_t